MLSRDTFKGIYGSFLTGLGDYTVDSRGDVGSWKREACLKALHSLTIAVTRLEGDSGDDRYLEKDTVTLFVGKVMQQAVEKMDKIRGLAGETFQDLLALLPTQPELIEERATLAAAIPKDSRVNWSSPSETVPIFVSLLQLRQYTRPLLVGLIVSAGGLTESTVRATSSELLKLLKNRQSLESTSLTLESFAAHLAAVFEENRQNSRVIFPAFATLDLLLSNDIFSSVNIELMSRLLGLIEDEIRGCKDAKKLLGALPVLCGFLTFEEGVRLRALTSILALLVSGFPKVRVETAAQLYTALLTLEDVVPTESEDEVTALLTETKW